MNRFLLLLILFTIVSANSFSQNESSPDTMIVDENIFVKVDKEASFPGGDEAWKKHLERNLNPMVPVDNGAPAGVYTVIIQFLVDQQGNVTEVKALTRQGYGMEQEVIRILKLIPAWSPAEVKNTPVKAYRKQPVTFVVIVDGLDITSNHGNYIYTDAENIITVEVSKLKPEDIIVTASQGIIIPKEPGQYEVKVNKPGRVVFDVFRKKGNKKIGAVGFDVRAKNPPVQTKE